MGFPPKYAEQMIYAFFKKYQDEHEKLHPPQTEELKKKWDDYKKKQEELAAQKKAQAAQQQDENSEDSKPKEESAFQEEKKEEPNAKAAPTSTPQKISSPSAASPQPIPSAGSSMKTDIEVDKTISTYNGAKTSKYNWSQSI